jgi:exosortase family protein XrtF
LKNYFIQYKPFLLFLGKFLLSYLVLTFVYESYLSQFDTIKNEVDDFTKLVANQTVKCLTFFGSDAYQMPNLEASSVKLFYNKKYIAQIIEGCNGLSVIVLFIAFVIAFTGKLKHTIAYIIGGSLMIHILNIARIALLCILIYSFPEYEEILHGVIFPLIIYGFVFLLWVIWINKFSIYASKTV